MSFRLEIQRFTLNSESYRKAGDTRYLTISPVGDWCRYTEACDAAAKIAANESYLLIEKAIIADTAAILLAQIHEIVKYPSATHLLPIRESLSIMGQQAILLENLSK